MQLQGISACITGGASGLGLQTAALLLARGAYVVIVDLPVKDGAARAHELGPNARSVTADVRDEAGLREALDVAQLLGPLRIVVNCAGVATPNRVLRKGTATPLSEFDEVVSTNLVGTFNMVRLAAERMVQNEPLDGERGIIVNTASVAAYDGQVGQAAYAASKAGVVGLTLPLARDLAQFNIRVMTIAPGIFDTPMLAGLSEEVRASLGEQIPHPSRLGRPSEYAALVEHIIDNPMLNGETIRLDGAIRMAPR